MTKRPGFIVTLLVFAVAAAFYAFGFTLAGSLLALLGLFLILLLEAQLANEDEARKETTTTTEEN